MLVTSSRDQLGHRPKSISILAALTSTSAPLSRTMADLPTFLITTRTKMEQDADSPTLGVDTQHPQQVQFSDVRLIKRLLRTVSSLTSLSDNHRGSIDTQVKVMMRQLKGAIEKLENLNK
ncbi:hypothetical protein BG004_005463, partial [Podila humilis]